MVIRVFMPEYKIRQFAAETLYIHQEDLNPFRYHQEPLAELRAQIHHWY